VLEVILDWKIFKQMFQKKKKKSHVTKIYPSFKKNLYFDIAGLITVFCYCPLWIGSSV